MFGKHMGFLLKSKNGETFFLGLRNSLKQIQICSKKSYNQDFKIASW